MTDSVEQERTTLAAVYADLNSRIEDLEQSKAGVRARLLQLGSGPAGALEVRVTSQRRLNVDRFTAKYGPDEFPGYYDVKPKAAMAKALGDDSVYDEGSPALRVTEAGEH